MGFNYFKQPTSLLLTSLSLLAACVLSLLPRSFAASLQVNTTLLRHSGDAISVTWSDMQPAPSDNITVIANNLTILLFSAAAHWSQGSGSLSFRLVNLYAPIVVAYTSSQGILAQSPAIYFSDPNEPLFPRLSLLGDAANSLVLTWTAARYTGSEHVLVRPAGCSQCQYKDFPLLPDGNVTYSIDDMCGGIAKKKGWFEPGWQLSAALYGLAPSSEFEYVFGSPDSMSLVNVMRSPPDVAAVASSNVHVFVFGDMGVAAAPPNGFPASLSTVNTIRSAAANFSLDDYTSILHIGDISYAMGYQFYWPLFLDQIQPLASRTVYQLSIGNHELCWPGVGFRPPWGDYGTDSGGECGVPFVSRFFLPNNRLWYSYNMGSVHFTVTSSEHDYTPGSEQHNWVIADLSAVDRSVTPWIVYTPDPLHVTTSVCNISQHACQIESPVFQALQVAWEDVLIQHNVTLVATAHIHYYERTCAVAHGVCVNSSSRFASQSAAASTTVQPVPAPSGAPIYIVVGPAGAPITPIPSPPHPSWSASLIDVFGFSVIHANISHFHFQFTADGSGEVLDEFIFTSSRSRTL